MVGEESSVVEAEEISRQPRNLGVESIVGVAREVSKAMYFLSMYPSEDVKDYAEEIALLISLKSYVSEEESPSTENLAMMKFLHLIIHNKELQEKLKNLDNFIRGIYGTSGFTNGKESYSRLCEVVTNFKLLNLSYKIDSLLYIKEKKDFTTLREICNVWDFYDLMTDKNFKQNIEEAVNEESEPFSEGFRKGMNDYIELAKKGENIASRHFEENIAFQAYCEEIDNASRALNVNLINYNGNEPIKISDILQQEKDIGKLNIYCNKKHDICARREDKKRCYEFKEGACYQMTSTWPVEDEFGNTSTCTMVMNVDSTGITKIVKFDGREFNDESYKKDKKLIEQNKELYIGDSPLCEAVKEFLKKQHGLGCGRENMVPIKIEKERCNSSPGVVPEGNTDSNNPTALSSANSDAPTQTGVNLQGNGVQAETDLQQQKIDELVQGNRELRNKLNEVNSMIGGLMRNFEGLKDNEKCRNRLQNVRTVRLESKVEELGERVDKIFGGIGDKRKIKSFESRIKKLWGLLPEEDRSYGYIGRGCGYYNLHSSESSSSEESEGYESSKEVTHL